VSVQPPAVVLCCLQACSSKQLDCVAELCKSGARAGVAAKSVDDVELHYAATNKEWSKQLASQVSFPYCCCCCCY